MLKNIIFIAIHFIFCSQAIASEFDLTGNVRAAGMGGAYTAVVDDDDSLFYNPASLSKVNGIYWKILDLGVGLSNLEVITQLSNLSGGSFGSTLAPLYGQPISMGIGAKTAITFPYFGVMYYNRVNAVLSLQTPVYPELEVNYEYDLGYGAGFAFPVVPGFLYGGMSFKRIARTGGAAVISGSLLGNNSASITQNLNNAGIAYSMDLGLNMTFPVPVITPSVSFVWKNVGNTAFNNVNLESDAENMILAGAVEFDIPLFTLTPSIEIRHLEDYNMQFSNKIHMGVEFSLPIVDVRAGFSQGYYTLGLGLGLGPLQIDMATYGVELGAYPGQLEDRRYVLSLSAKLGIGGLGGIINEMTGSSSETGVGKARRKRLKQRR